MEWKPYDATIIGAGWLGSALASVMGLRPVSRRDVDAGGDFTPRGTVFVASGHRAASRSHEVSTLRTELLHLRRVLDACERAGVPRVIVLGSSDVAGTAAVVTGSTPQSPLTAYARVKAALEDECVVRAARGTPVTCVRLAPVHGPGKAKSQMLVRLAGRRFVPLPGGGRQSMGFVLLDDAVQALLSLGGQPAPAVVAIGGGPTPLRELLEQLARAQGRRPRWVNVPVPSTTLRRVAGVPMPETVHWLLRLSLPRVVEMEVPTPVTPLPEAAARLVASC